MKRSGTVVNGAIVFDDGATLPEGARVHVAIEETYEYPHPLAPYDRKKEIALLRERLAELDAGVPGLSVEEAFAQIDEELGRRKGSKMS